MNTSWLVVMLKEGVGGAWSDLGEDVGFVYGGGGIGMLEKSALRMGVSGLRRVSICVRSMSWRCVGRCERMGVVKLCL